MEVVKDVGSSKTKGVVHGFLFWSEVILNDFRVALLAESIAVPNPMKLPVGLVVRTTEIKPDSRATGSTLLHNGGLQEFHDQVLPGLEDQTVFVRIPLAPRRA